MTPSKKAKAKWRKEAYSRQLANEIFGSRTVSSPIIPQPLSTSSLPTMSSDYSPPRRSFSAPRGPRAEEGFNFTSDTWRGGRNHSGRDSSDVRREYRERSRSRSRSPGSGRRPSDRYDRYENREYESYRPAPTYSETPTRPSLKDKDTRREFSKKSRHSTYVYSVASSPLLRFTCNHSASSIIILTFFRPKQHQQHFRP